MLKPGADAIDALLPQTQCTRCGFAGCRPYAEAIERGEAGINQCPPGGAATILSLSRLLGREPLPLDPAHGTEREPTVAWIDESLCIGCARCLPRYGWQLPDRPPSDPASWSSRFPRLARG